MRAAEVGGRFGGLVLVKTAIGDQKQWWMVLLMPVATQGLLPYVTYGFMNGKKDAFSTWKFTLSTMSGLASPDSDLASRGELPELPSGSKCHTNAMLEAIAITYIP